MSSMVSVAEGIRILESMPAAQALSHEIVTREFLSSHDFSSSATSSASSTAVSGDDAPSPSEPLQKFPLETWNRPSSSSSSSSSLYEHLVDTVCELLEKRPQHPISAFPHCERRVLLGRSIPDIAQPNQLPSLVSSTPKGTQFSISSGQEDRIAFRNLIHPPKGPKEEKYVIPDDGEEVEGEFADLDEEEKNARQRVRSGDDDDEEVVEEEEAPEMNEGVVPDLASEISLLELSGSGLADDEVYRLHVAMRRLVEQNPLESVRFFGKILGLSSDYYVVEAVYKEDARPRPEYLPPDSEDAGEAGEEENDEETLSELGDPKPLSLLQNSIPPEEQTGANRFRYFVCSFPGSLWHALPDVTPEQIHAARRIRRFFTGILDAPVIAHPKFPGTEREFLRAQIARIAAATSLIPATIFKREGEEEPDPDDPEAVAEPPSYLPPEELVGLELREERTPLSVDALLDARGWVHSSHYILHECDRCTLPPKDENAEAEEPEDEEEEDDEDADDEQKKKRKKKKKPQPERCPPILTSIFEDRDIFGSSAWTIKECRSALARSKYVISAKSKRWPGAVCIVSSSAHSTDYVSLNAYFGYGLKVEEEPYAPVAPPSLSQEALSAARGLDEPQVQDEEIYLPPPPPPPAPEESEPNEEGDEEKDDEDED